MKKCLIPLSILLGSLCALTQTDSRQNNPALPHRITVVTRTISAVNYRHRSSSTRVDFQGTSLLPGAGGNAEVKRYLFTAKVQGLE